MAGVPSDRLITCAACRDSCVTYVATQDMARPTGFNRADAMLVRIPIVVADLGLLAEGA